MNKFKKTAVLVFGYTFLVSIVTYPLIKLVVCNSQSTIIGIFHNPDFPGTLWFNWWFNYCLDNKLNFFHTQYLSFPYGENLWCMVGNFVMILIFHPFNKLLGLIAGYNFLSFLVLILNCIAGFLLINVIVENRLLSFLGGFIIGVNQYTLRELMWGRLDQFAIFFFLFVLWALVKLKYTKKKSYVFVFIIFFILNALSSWHYLIILVCILLFWLFLAWLREEYHFLKYGLFSLSLGILILSPVLLIFLRELNAELHLPLINYALASEYFPFLRIMTDHSLDPITSFSFSPSFKENFDLVKISPFILVLSFIFIIKNWRSRNNKVDVYWNIVWFIALLLSLGPLLQLDHYVVRIGMEHYIYLPFYFLAKYVPFFSRFFWPYRFLLVFYISSAVIILTSIEPWFNKENFLKKEAFFICFIFIVLGELSFYSCYIFPLRTTTIEISEVYSRLKNLPDGVVLELPYCQGQSDIEYVYYQTIHEKKLFNSSLALSPKELLTSKYRKFISRFEMQKTGIFIKDENDIEILKKIGVRYIVLNMERFRRNLRYDPFTIKKITLKISNLLGVPSLYDPSTGIYLFILN